MTKMAVTPFHLP